MENTFVIRRRNARPQPFRPVDLFDERPPTDARYFARVLHLLNQKLGPRSLRFLLTWELDADADEHSDAIVLLVGDERYQVPGHLPKAKLVFKTGGTTPNPIRRTLALPPSIGARVIVRDARNAAVRLRRRCAGVAPLNALRDRVFGMPLGYAQLLDVPWVDWPARRTDVFFAGTVPAGKSRFQLRPSVAARRQMGEAVAELTRRRPDLLVACGAGNDAPYGPEEYSTRMMNARIALCPRGNFDETFRLFESAKSGCVIVTEPLPDRWYYKGLPAVTLRQWSQLPRVVDELLRDNAALERAAVATRAWWESHADENAVADFMLERIEASLRTP
ncbi:MAG TPA: hypothetical protein VF624_08845 [Tepidisphaeraceae bacterium]|jgi:hypothetical protein